MAGYRPISSGVPAQAQKRSGASPHLSVGQFTGLLGGEGGAGVAAGGEAAAGGGLAELAPLLAL
jgi:hypothetical protein